MRLSILLIGAFFALGAEAEAAPDDRYVLEKSVGGYVRMDRLSGEMSLCADKDGQLVCRIAADERKAVDGEFDVLMKRIESLEVRIAALEGRPPPASGLPSEEEFDKAMGFMERFFRRFMGIMRGLESENETNPQKT